MHADCGCHVGHGHAGVVASFTRRNSNEGLEAVFGDSTDANVGRHGLPCWEDNNHRRLFEGTAQGKNLPAILTCTGFQYQLKREQAKQKHFVAPVPVANTLLSAQASFSSQDMV